MTTLTNSWQTVGTWRLQDTHGFPGCGGWVNAHLQMIRVNNTRSQARIWIQGNREILFRNNATWSVTINGVNRTGQGNTGGNLINITNGWQLGGTVNIDYAAGTETIGIGNVTLTFPSVRFGWRAPFRTLNTVTINRAFSTVRVNVATPPAPPPPPPRTNWGRRWNGTSWVPMTPRRWNGTAWVTCRIRRWNGTAWVDVT